jgi:hypothetical protein
MRRFFSFWWQCARIAFWGNTAFANDWQWLFGVPAASGLAAFVASRRGATDLTTTYPILDGILAALAAFIITWVVAFLVRLLNAPVQLDKQNAARLRELEKIDRFDLQHMLGGVYFGDTFMYGAEITLCKKYDGKFEIEHLKDGFDMISVRAPKNSLANISFRFMNARQNLKYRFYFRDGKEQESEIQNIYECQNIYLDAQARFGLKFVCEEQYLIDERASLTVGIKSWTK